MRFVLVILVAILTSTSVSAWQQHQQQHQHQQLPTTHSTTVRLSTARTALYATPDTKEKTPTVEETTEKYGLEAGLWKSMKQNDGGESAKSLLKKYGIAYLATSIPLAVISFCICYVLVDNGVNVAGLLEKIGIQGGASEKAGTFAIAYAAHKAASPIRFPPTVLLTPVVAKLIGKEVNENEKDDAANGESSYRSNENK
jgi:hypothetical protein